MKVLSARCMAHSKADSVQMGDIMRRIGKFQKVSFGRFQEDWENQFGRGEHLEEIYQGIRLPLRATALSAGYDFYTPVQISLKPGESVMIPTGIRVEMEEGWVLTCYPRSGLGIRYRMQLDNTVGIIDGDYFYADNEGHIQAKMTNCSQEGKCLSIPAGGGFMQGIFLPFGIAVDDQASGRRTGGFGSTGV